MTGGFIVGKQQDRAVAVFSRNTTTDALTFVEVLKRGGSRVNSVTVGPDGKHLYAAGSLDDAVAVFSVAPPPSPTESVEQASGQADPTNASPINFTVTFSADVTGFTSGDVTLSGTANASTAVVSGGPAIYNVAVSGMAGDGAGNTSTASTSTDNTSAMRLLAIRLHPSLRRSVPLGPVKARSEGDRVA